METKFVKLSRPVLIGFRDMPAGSVVEVDERRALDLVKLGDGILDGGPAFEPSAEVVKTQKGK